MDGVTLMGIKNICYHTPLLKMSLPRCGYAAGRLETRTRAVVANCVPDRTASFLSLGSVLPIINALKIQFINLYHYKLIEMTDLGW